MEDAQVGPSAKLSGYSLAIVLDDQTLLAGGVHSLTLSAPPRRKSRRRKVGKQTPSSEEALLDEIVERHAGTSSSRRPAIWNRREHRMPAASNAMDRVHATGETMQTEFVDPLEMQIDRLAQLGCGCVRSRTAGGGVRSGNPSDEAVSRATRAQHRK